MRNAANVETKAVATGEAEILRQLSGLVRKEDSGGEFDQLPLLKINYDNESEFKVGSWVVGQKKDKDDNITDQGVQAVKMIILSIRRRYSFYNQLDTTKNCSSTIYTDGDTVVGNKYGYNCQSGDCPHRDPKILPRCKAQWVIFGMAITSDAKLIDCMGYIQGSSYMPFSEFKRDKLLKIKLDDGGYQVLPPFAQIVNLGTERQKNGASTYYTVDFKIDRLLSGADELNVCLGRRDMFDELIRLLNMKAAATTAPVVTVKEATTSAPDFSKMSAKPSDGASDIFDGDNPDVLEAEFSTKTEPEEMGSDPDEDIETKIQNAIMNLGKK